MVEAVLGYVHDATTLLFGVFVSAAFLGVSLDRRHVRDLLLFSVIFGAVSVGVSVAMGPTASKQLYPFMVHLPLIVFLSVRFRQRPLACTVAVLIAYLCCQVSNWVGIAVLAATDAQWAYFLARILITVGTFALLIRLLTNMDVSFLQKSTRSLLIFGLLPAVYYAFDYATNVYSGILHSGSVVAVEFLGFALCIFYILFLLVYFKQYEEGERAKQRAWMLRTQMEQSSRELETLKRSEHELAVLRHDMRHYLTSISSYIGYGEIEKAQALIADVVSAADATRPERYCANDVVNMVVTNYAHKAATYGVKLTVTARVPIEVGIEDVDLFAFLSNALENAVAAASACSSPTQRLVSLEMRMRDQKLLVELSNTFRDEPVLIDGVPTTTREGHGLGTQSILCIAEKLNGNCQFSISDGRFVLRAIL